MKRQRRRVIVALSLVTSVLGAIGYGCSDEKAPPAGTSSGGTSGTSSNDSGGSKDTSTSDTNSSSDTGADSAKLTAKATIAATSDASTVTGSATFTEENGEVTVVISISNGIPPGDAGLHGMHIHVNGSCAANDSGVDGSIVFAGAAGGHWNPLDAGHGYPDATAHHLGDMGNVLIDGTGKGTLTLVSKDWTVQPGSKSVVGHAVIFHQQTDDGVTQPVGNAGARPGCGVIVLQ